MVKSCSWKICLASANEHVLPEMKRKFCVLRYVQISSGSMIIVNCFQQMSEPVGESLQLQDET